jgi:hypothetical protein
MARQESLVTLTGTMGGLSFYKTRDGFQARKKGSIDRNRILTDPKFERTRENFAEFGAAGRASRVLRTALRGLVAKVPASGTSNRLQQTMMKVVKADATNDRGQRNVVDGEIGFLLGFEFNGGAPLAGTLRTPFTSSVDRAAGTTVVNIPAFVPTEAIAAPPGATHFRLLSQASEVDFETETFVVNNDTTVELPLDDSLIAPVVMNNAVPAASVHPIFVVLGIEFLQQVNGKYYAMKNGGFNALSIVNVSAE